MNCFKKRITQYWLFPVLLILYSTGFWLQMNQSIPEQVAPDLSSVSTPVSALPLPEAPVIQPLSVSEFKQSFHNTRARKQYFFSTLKPLIEAENQFITAQRDWLLSLDHANLNEQQIRLYNQLSALYRVPDNIKEPSQRYSVLLERIDTLPPELVLVQAANESAWGQSRFAQQGNNLFGQWCFSEGCGLIPSRRSAGSTHEVAVYPSLQESIRAYMRNLNTFRAYNTLRKIRSEARKQGQGVSGETLANGLIHYSERGQSYVYELQKMMRQNKPLMDLSTTNTHKNNIVN